MAFLRPDITDTVPVLRRGSIMLRVPHLNDYPDWARLRAESRAFLKPWEPSWARDDLSRASFRRRMRHYQNDVRQGLAFPFFIFDDQDDTLVGGITLSNIRRGVSQSGTLGYWIGERHARRGYMTAAVMALADFAFSTLNLHRIEAACLPANRASIGLLEKCDFQKEGYARKYLKIDAFWQDHLLFARLRQDGQD
jgi:ribosomal-protein-alanine N-acetyltransferase